MKSLDEWLEEEGIREEVTDRAVKRLQNAIAIQKIEGNSLTSDEITMFESFERQGLSGDQRRTKIFNRLSDSGKF